MTDQSDALAGKTITRVEYDYDEALRVHFTDGSMLYVSAVWHNDSTAGTEVALIPADMPKSYKEGLDFYSLMRDRTWD